MRTLRLIFKKFSIQGGRALRKLVKIICTIFIVAGIILLVAGFGWIHQKQNFLANCLETEGHVIDLSWKDDTAYAVFRFVDERTGEEITVVSSLGRKPLAYSVGQEVCVLYDPLNPHNAVIKSFWNIWFTPIVLTSLGGIFLSVGLIPFGFDVRRRRTVEYLKTRGETIHGKVINIYVDTTYRVQGQHPWRIAVQWVNPNSGRLHVFKSDRIWYNPSEFVKIGEEMEVRIDPKNPKRHWVNIDHLPKRAD